MTLRAVAREGSNFDSLTPEEVKTLYESNPDTNAFTDAEKTKLAGLEAPHYRGTFTDLVDLVESVLDPIPGDYADVDSGAGSEVKRYIWDDSDQLWVAQAGESSIMTAAQVKALYESNPDTNAFTNAEKTKLQNIEPFATANATDAELRDRSTHTGVQGMSTIVGLEAALASKAEVVHTHVSTAITDSTTVGRNVLTASSQAAARTAIGAGTSNLVIGTSGTTAKAGNWFPTIAEVDGLAAALASKPSGDAVVLLVGDQTINGVKSFQSVIEAKAGIKSTVTTGVTDDIGHNILGGSPADVVAGSGFRVTSGAVQFYYVGFGTSPATSPVIKAQPTVVTFSVPVVLPASAPTLGTHATNKTYVDGLISSHTHTISQVTGLQAALDAKVPTTRTITASTGLTGGGALSANRSIALSAASIASLAKADTALQAGDLTVFSRTEDGLVPTPGGSTTTRYLREDGTWTTPPNTTFSSMSLAEINAGTSSSSRVITAKVLNDWLNPKLGAVTNDVLNQPMSLSTVYPAGSIGEALQHLIRLSPNKTIN